ncbi:MAG: helix-turn-helix domain-containing protein [Methanobacteriota archaeon]
MHAVRALVLILFVAAPAADAGPVTDLFDSIDACRPSCEVGTGDVAVPTPALGVPVAGPGPAVDGPDPDGVIGSCEGDAAPAGGRGAPVLREARSTKDAAPDAGAVPEASLRFAAYAPQATVPCTVRQSQTIAVPDAKAASEETAEDPSSTPRALASGSDLVEVDVAHEGLVAVEATNTVRAPDSDDPAGADPARKEAEPVVSPSAEHAALVGPRAYAASALPTSAPHAPAAAAGDLVASFSVPAAIPVASAVAERPTSVPPRVPLAVYVVVGLAAALVALYSRIAGDRATEHALRAALYERVRAGAGVQAADLARETATHITTVLYHLRRLEASGLVRAHKAARGVCWTAAGARPGAAELAGSRSPTGRALLAAVAERPGRTTTDLAAAVGTSVQLAHYHLQRLARAALLSRTEDAGSVRWDLPGAVQTAVPTSRPTP